VFAIFLVVSSLFLLSLFVATITSKMTVEALQENVDSINDLEGQRVATITESTSAAFLTLAPKTIAMMRSDVERFVVQFNYSEDINHRAVRRYLAGLGVTVQTQRRILSGIKNYWNFLQDKFELDDADPFINAIPRSKTRASGKVRKDWQPEDLVRVYRAAKDTDLKLLIRIAAHTGARREELCSPTTVFNQETITVVDAKTSTGIRTVPVHDDIKPLINDWVVARKNLKTNKFGDMSDAIGKRFGRLKTELGYDKSLVFHSIRATVATLLENAGVPEGVSADIVGHEKPNMTYGLYSGGASLEVKRQAINLLKYPEWDA
jgi:integrase